MHSVEYLDIERSATNGWIGYLLIAVYYSLNSTHLQILKFQPGFANILEL